MMSKRATALQYLQDRKGQAVPLGALVVVLGYDADTEGRNQASMLVGTAANRAGRNSNWRHVKNVGRGLWMYDDTEVPEAGQWDEVTHEETTFVLRSPQGRLYLARPLNREPA